MTWGFRRMIGKRDLCITCASFNNGILDEIDCPRSTLPESHQENFGAIRCNFYEVIDAAEDSTSVE